MSTQNIHGDSLLSSISNISVKIDHTEIDDPVFLRCVYGKNCQDGQFQYEVPIQMIDDNQEIDQGSLMERVYLKCKGQVTGLEQHQKVDTWVAVKQTHGMSQDESQQPNNEVSQFQPIAKDIKQTNPTQEAQLELQQRKRFIQLQQQKRLKNETKNIPKNYGKAIITFIQKYKDKVKMILEIQGVEYEEFLLELRDRKKVINTIADLRNMWVDYKYAKCMRLLSNLFLRRYSLSYIFNSRICNYSSHIKYRHRLAEAIKHPHSFKHIKDY